MGPTLLSAQVMQRQGSHTPASLPHTLPHPNWDPMLCSSPEAETPDLWVEAGPMLSCKGSRDLPSLRLPQGKVCWGCPAGLSRALCALVEGSPVLVGINSPRPFLLRGNTSAKEEQGGRWEVLEAFEPRTERGEAKDIEGTCRGHAHQGLLAQARYWT